MADENWDEFGDCEIVPDMRYRPSRWDTEAHKALLRDNAREARREAYAPEGTAPTHRTMLPCATCTTAANCATCKHKQ